MKDLELHSDSWADLMKPWRHCNAPWHCSRTTPTSILISPTSRPISVISMVYWNGDAKRLRLTHRIMSSQLTWHKSFTILACWRKVIAGQQSQLQWRLNPLLADEHELVFGDDLYAAPAPSIQDAPRPRISAFVNDAPASRVQVPKPPRPSADLPRQTAAGVPALVLQSVVTSHEGRFAVINGKLYKEGSELAGCTLRAVADDWVLMERLGEQFVLEIESNDAVEASR